MSVIRGPERKRGRASPILASLVLCALTIFSFVMLRNSAYRSESVLLKASSEKIASQIAAELQAMLDTGEQFQTMLLTDAGKTYESLRPLAEKSLAGSPYIDSITIAPGAIVRYSFPEETGSKEPSSSSIGHDLLDNPERMQALVAAVSKKKAVLQGPSVSAEGKNLAFLRIPVLDQADLWGFVSIGFDTDRMFADFDLPSEFPGLSVAVASSGPEDRGRRVFWGDQRALQGYAAEVMEGKGGAEVFPWTVYTASAYPAVRVVWWGAGLLALSMVGLGLFVQGIVRRQRRPMQETHRRESVGFGESRAEDAEKASRPEASFVVRPFVPKTDEKEPLPGEAPQPVGEETVGEEPSAGSPATVAPAAEPAEVQKRMPEEPAPSPAEETAAPISVLVVDDSEVNRELLLRMLVLRGYEAQAVSSGLLALDALRERRFDVLLIDCVMPEMDGYALAAAVRAAGRERSSVLVDLFGQETDSILGMPAMVAMSPRHDPEEVKKCADAGFDSLLIKPFTMTSLDQKIQETLGRGT
jgi:CheY-like chemotaxis protein